jgi:flagellar M-ring protein FliF
VDLQSLLTRLRALGANFTVGQLASLFVSFAIVVGVVFGSAMWLNQPNYALLFADMDQESVAQVVTRLKSMKVQYVLDEGGRSIRVPSSRVDELRLELTAEGMPASGRIGFEIFDRTSFGATEFVEQVNYRRALEGEIARTINTISEVAGARVHIAMGKDSLFGEKRPAKASVVLKLKDSRAGLPAGTVAGISNLVAASVEGLRPEAVVIVDSLGRPLSRPGDDDEGLGAAQLERQQRLEQEMATRVIALLEPVVGEGRARVNVALKLNPKSRELTEERWDPNTVVRSRQTSADMSSLTPVAGGIAGARGNMPVAAPTGTAPATTATAAAAPTVPPGPGSSRQTETTNYEVSRTTTRTIEPPGDVARLSVAVILDDAHEVKADGNGQQTVTRTPRKPEEIQKLQALVAAAVGIDETRGDQITVENVSFEEVPASEPEPPSFWTRYGSPIQESLRYLGILVLVLVALLFVVRPMVTTAAAAAKARPVAAVASGPRVAALPSGDRPRTVAEIESQLEAQIDSDLEGKAEGQRRLPVLTRRVAGMAQKEPENTAKLIRSWMSDREDA